MANTMPLVIAGLSGVGGMFGNRAQKTAQTSTSTTNLTPEQLLLQQQLIAQQAKLSAGTDLTGYESGQISDINNLRQLQQQRLQETMALHGITGPAEGAAMAGLDNQRFGDITKLHQSIPLMQNDLQTKALQSGMSLFGSMPKNTTSTGTGTQAGNVAGGGIGNLAATLAYLYGQGAFKPTNTMNTGPTLSAPSNVMRTPDYITR